MSLRSTVALYLVAILAAGCLPSIPVTPQSQARLLLAEPKAMGKLDAQLSQESPKKLTYATSKIDQMRDRPLRFAGIVDGRVCFVATARSNADFSTEEVAVMWTKRRHFVAAHPNTTTLETMSDWPTSGTELDTIEILDEQITQDQYRKTRTLLIQLCGDAPLLEGARYLSVATVPSSERAGLLYLWSIGP